MNSTARDTLYLILLNTNPSTISQYCQINRNARQICNSNHFWQQKYLKDFGPIGSTPNIDWFETYRNMYKTRWALNPKKAFIIIVQNRGELVGTPIVVLNHTVNEILQKIVDVYNNDQYNYPLYDIINQLKTIVGSDEEMPDKPTTVQQLLTFFHELDVYPVDVYLADQAKSERAFVIITDYSPSKLIAVIGGRDEIDIMQKVVDVYNNNVTTSPLYSVIDSVLHLDANDPDYIEPTKPISLELFWEEVQTNRELMWQIYPVKVLLI